MKTHQPLPQSKKLSVRQTPFRKRDAKRSYDERRAINFLAPSYSETSIGATLDTKVKAAVVTFLKFLCCNYII